MNALWITLALLTAGFVGWPVTAWVFRLARTIDDRADAGSGAGGDAAEDPAADSTTDPDLRAAPEPAGQDGAAPTPAAAAAAPPGGGRAVHHRNPHLHALGSRCRRPGQGPLPRLTACPGASGWEPGKQGDSVSI